MPNVIPGEVGFYSEYLPTTMTLINNKNKNEIWIRQLKYSVNGPGESSKFQRGLHIHQVI